jgi:hypothetical protein
MLNLFIYGSHLLFCIKIKTIHPSLGKQQAPLSAAPSSRRAAGQVSIHGRPWPAAFSGHIFKIMLL